MNKRQPTKFSQAQFVKRELDQLLETYPEFVGAGITFTKEEGYSVKVNFSRPPKNLPDLSRYPGVKISTHLAGRINLL